RPWHTRCRYCRRSRQESCGPGSALPMLPRPESFSLLRDLSPSRPGSATRLSHTAQRQASHARNGEDALTACDRLSRQPTSRLLDREPEPLTMTPYPIYDRTSPNYTSHANRVKLLVYSSTKPAQPLVQLSRSQRDPVVLASIGRWLFR